MALMDFIKKQFIDILQWTEDGDGVLAWRHPMQDFEIQYGASLTVRASQMALFVNEGRVADVFAPGRYTLTTQTLPLLTYLQNWDKGFESPFKSDVYFFSTRSQLDRKWGTPNPITIRDKDFGIVRLRAFGIYAYHLVDPQVFHTRISGTRDVYTRDELEGQLRNTLIGSMTDLFAESGVPFIDMAGLGAGVGAGVGFGQVMGQAMAQAVPPAAAVPVAAPSADEIVATLEKLHGLVDKGILSQAEFDAKKAELLRKIT